MKKVHILLLATVVGCFHSGCSSNQLPPLNRGEHADSVKGAKTLIPRGALILDARSPEEFAEGHIPGAINVPHLKARQYLPAIGDNLERPIVVYCRSGKRAEILKESLNGLGYSQVFNGGGMSDLQSRP